MFTGAACVTGINKFQEHTLISVHEIHFYDIGKMNIMEYINTIKPLLHVYPSRLKRIFHILLLLCHSTLIFLSLVDVY